ncbi:MAG TPA: DUF1573 domain-containing protein [Dysgonamonadaceae bacterium]|jgi:hypothetical protein|nr:DUF1573 domain-containing protein [Dysgonamonadaceae bacterium]
MKKISLTLLLTIVMSGILFAQNKPEVTFKKNVHDYGSIKEEVEVAVSEFEFTNTGKSPVVIQRVIASCGCTTPSYTREPVLPGKSGEIKVAYSTSFRPGTFQKNIRIYTNVPDTVYTLTIKGNVIPKPR